MALALRVDEYLPLPPPPPRPVAVPPSMAAGVRVPLKTPSIEKELLESLDLLQTTVGMLEEYTKSLEKGSDGLIEAAEKIRDLQRLDETILELREREKGLADAWLPGIKRALVDREKALRSRHPLKRVRFAELVSRDAKAKLRGLEIMRDCRLRLAEIAAELDSESDSPIFENTEELESYMKSL